MTEPEQIKIYVLSLVNALKAANKRGAFELEESGQIYTIILNLQPWLEEVKDVEEENSVMKDDNS